MGSCMFKAGYCLYADTCIGRCLHNRFISSFQRQFGENAMHSKLTPFVFEDLMILPVPVLVNNYAYLVCDLTNNILVLVDVGDATIVKKLSIEPQAILTTHKHWDHSGGNRMMRSIFPTLKVYGGIGDRVPDSTDHVTNGQELRFGKLRFTAIWTPGHTKGHMVWRLDGSVFHCSDSVFTGDLMMLAGCGASFEGPLRQMNASLCMMKELPDDTMVWPGHEMAVENLELAAFIEPDNIRAVLKLVWTFSQRELRLCTCPSTIGEEKTYNPFLRASDEKFHKALGILARTQCPHHPMSEDEIAELCFHSIIAKAVEMGNIRRATREAAKKKRQEGGDQEEQQENQRPEGDRADEDEQLRQELREAVAQGLHIHLVTTTTDDRAQIMSHPKRVEEPKLVKENVVA